MKNQGLKILLLLVVIGLVVYFYFVTTKQVVVPVAVVPTAPTSTTTPIVSPTPVPPQPPIPVTNTVTIESLSPVSGPVGTTVTISGSGFTANNKVLLDGNVGATNTHVSLLSNGKQTLIFTIPSAVGPNCKPDQACPQYMRLVTPATYQITVENENGTSSALSFAVTGKALDSGIQ